MVDRDSAWLQQIHDSQAVKRVHVVALQLYQNISGANKWQQERLSSLILFMQYDAMDAVKGWICIFHMQLFE